MSGPRPLRPLAPTMCSALLCALGCTGQVVAPTGEPGAGSAEDLALVDDATAAPVRRLANDELATAIDTLTGTRPAALAMLPGDVADGRTLFFPGLAGRQSLVRVETLLAIADEAAAGMSAERVAAIAPGCATSVDRACAEAFAAGFASQAYRRPVEDEERDALLALYDDAEEHDEGVRQIVRAVLLSPSFLYVVETARDEPAAPPGLVALSDREIATRLALALTDDLPDETLRAAAEAGALHEPAQIRAQAERIFDGERARATVARFFDYWLGLSEVDDLTRDATAYPAFDAALNASMLTETRTFVAHEVWVGEAPLAELFDADFSFVDARLGAVYGLDVEGEAPVRVTLPPERRGLLTHAAILAHDQGSVYTRPIQRSAYILRRLLCADLPPPPIEVDATPRSSEPGSTTRQTYESLTSATACASCHQTLNPPGFAFEDFDAIGAHRTSERGHPVDASGAIASIDAVDLSGGGSVGPALADADAIHTCFARQWLRYSLARVESRADGTSLRAIADASRAGAPLREVMLSAVTTFAFAHRTVPAE